MKIYNNYPDGKILWFNDFYLDDNKFIFSAGNFNGLYEYSLKDKKLYFLGNFDQEHVLARQLYGKVHKHGDKLFFTPLSAEHIAIYDLSNKSFEALALPFPKVPCGFDCKFLNSIMYDNKIYMFPGYVSYIAEYDLEKKKLLTHDDWYLEYIKKWKKKTHLLFNFDMVNIGDKVYLPSAQHNGLFRYCLNKNEFKFIEINYKFSSVSTLAYDGEFFWSCTDNGKLLKMDIDGVIIKVIEVSAIYGESKAFVSSVYADGYLWLFSSQNSIVLKVDCNDIEHKSEILKYSEKENEYTNLEYHVVNFVKKIGDKIYFMSRSNREIKSIFNGTISSYLDKISDTTGYSERNVETTDVYEAYTEYLRKRNQYSNEEQDIVLEEQTVVSETIFYMLNEIKQHKESDNYCFNAGAEIFKSCMQEDRTT